MVTIQLTAEDENGKEFVVFNNPLVNSPWACRPLQMKFAKETKGTHFDFLEQMIGKYRVFLNKRIDGLKILNTLNFKAFFGLKVFVHTLATYCNTPAMISSMFKVFRTNFC